MDLSAVLSAVWAYLKLVLLLSARQFIFLFALSLILSYLMHLVNIRLLNQSHRLFGGKAYNWLFGWISVPVHELGHAIFAILFGHKITRLVLFDPEARSGYGGLVSHTWNKDNIYHRIGNLFIGLGPIITGSLAVWLLSKYLLGFSFSQVEIFDAEAGLFSQVQSIPSFIMNGFANAVMILGNISSGVNWKTVLFLYLSFAIGTNICLSDLDIGHLKPALLLIVMLLLVFNLATAWLGDFSLGFLDHLETALSVFYGILIYVLILNLAFLCLVFILNKIFGK